MKAVRWVITRGLRQFDKVMLSEWKGDFEDTDMSHKMDEFLQAVRLPADIDTIPDSTSDSEAQPTPHPLHPPSSPYENVDFTTILGSVSIIT
jgi:hypothetical protein